MIVIESVKNPVYASTRGDEIDSLVKFQHLPAEVEFTASSYDPEEYGVQLYNSLIKGDFGPIAPYVAPLIPVG